MLCKADLIHDLEKGCKDPKDFKIGTEHERFLYDLNHHRLPYQGEKSVQKVLDSFEQFDYEPILENGNIIGLFHPGLKNSITIEPGGQLELSGTPLKTLHETKDELAAYEEILNSIKKDHNIMIESYGVDPHTALEDVPWMPKKRYDIMKAYMPTVGSHGHYMMRQTATIQTNLDFSDERDMVLKFRLGMILQPFMTALFANSSLYKGAKTEYQSFRSYIWQHTDPDRCGLCPMVFEDTFSFEHYVDYMLSVPMYFIKRKGVYHDVAGADFRDFIKGELSGFDGEYATLSDWHDHLTIAFPEVRLKQFLEFRGADGHHDPDMIMAVSAILTGLLYDKDALRDLEAVTKDWTYKDIKDLYARVPYQGIKASFKGHSLNHWWQTFINFSEKGLENRNYLNKNKQNETIYLEIVKSKNLLEAKPIIF